MPENRELQDKPWYSPEEVAHYFDLNPDTIRELARKGQIPGARQIGRSWRIPRSYVLGDAPPPPKDKQERR
jgi:excisionase family DNA binding protein